MTTSVQAVTAQLTPDAYRETFHTPLKPPTLPDQWVDWGDHTTTLDPTRQKKWIYDGDEGHMLTEDRGRHYDRREVQNMLGWEQRHHAEPIPFYTPSQRLIDGMDKWPTPLARGCRSWRGEKRDTGRYGALPSVTASIYDNSLLDKDTDTIQSEILESERRQGARLFDCDTFKGNTSYDTNLPHYTTRLEQRALAERRRVSDYQPLPYAQLLATEDYTPSDWKDESKLRRERIHSQDKAGFWVQNYFGGTEGTYMEETVYVPKV